MSYPVTRKCDSADEFFGHTVHDPYRWLEEDSASEVGPWERAQNEITFEHLSSIPFREKLHRRLSELWDHARYSVPFTRGGWRYFFRNEGLQNQAVLCRQKNGDAPEVFLDPNGFSADGTTSLGGIGFSPDGRYAAYSVSQAGSDWQDVRVICCDAPADILEMISDVKFTALSWRGNEGFYYSCYPKPQDGSVLTAKTSNHRLMFHRLGTEQRVDQLVFGGDRTPRRYISGKVTEDGRWLCVRASVSTTGNELYVLDLTRDHSHFIPIAQGFEKNYELVDSHGEFLYVETNHDAPNNRLVRVDMASPGSSEWIDIIPERSEVLSVTCGGGFFYAAYMKDAISRIEQVDASGDVVREITLPGPGTATGFSALKNETHVFFDFTSYVHPREIYSLDVSTGESRLFHSSMVKFNASDYVSSQIFYRSADGTEIPMMITRHRKTPLSGDNRCLLYGYGGFNASISPTFSIPAVVWMEHGGIYAVPNIRGGGEYGEPWHLAGTGMRKQNVFDDFISAAEFLIAKGYTSSSRLALQGRSNGGLLVGAVMTQRPELLRVALPTVGVMDMLRYHRFTAGAGWAYDYGTADDGPEMFAYLLGYSPLHNIRDGVCYPATLISTGDHDDRVVPAHSFKFAARLQEAQGCDNPVLLRIDMNSGHGAGKPMPMIIAAEADQLAFALWHTGTVAEC